MLARGHLSVKNVGGHLRGTMIKRGTRNFMLVVDKLSDLPKFPLLGNWIHFS